MLTDEQREKVKEAIVFSRDSLLSDNGFSALISKDDVRLFIAVAESCLELTAQNQALRTALEASERLIDVALPQFNWHASALNASAIRLLNEVPGQVRAALAVKEQGHE